MRGLTGNKLIVALTGSVMLIVLIGVVSLMNRDPAPELSAPRPAVPIPPEDADTYADTVEAMSIEVQDVRSTFDDVTETLRRQQATLEQLSGAVDNVSERDEDSFEATLKAVEELIGAKIEDLNIDAINAGPPPLEWVDAINAEFDEPEPKWIVPREELVFGQGEPISESSDAAPPADDWVGRLDRIIDQTTDGLTQGSQRTANRLTGQRQSDNVDGTPIYTIPKNATVFQGVAATALIGRVPNGGQVRDPYRFKLLTGPDAIASNAFPLPSELAGMVWSGTAVGDWGLGCVRGKLDSVTFTFADGRIVTHTESSNLGLGWISDQQGNPCIDGTKVSNAAGTLSARALGAGLESGASAFAEGEKDRIVADGVVVTDIDDAGELAGFEALSRGASTFNRYLDRRLQSVFDAIYAPNGTRVLVHVETEIPLDRHPNQRSVFYDTFYSDRLD